MEAVRPEVVVVAAAKVGGILANDTYPADFLYENLLIEANLIHAAHRVGVAKLLFLGSSCIYPREAPQPIAEDALLTGPLEPTNEWYAIAKIAGIKLCQAYRRQHGCDFISAMPCNLYGPNDYFHPDRSHVIPALLRRFHEAARRGDAEVVCWGTGRPRREFLHVDDLAEACAFLLRHYSAEAHVNVGTGSDISIADLAEAVAGVTGFRGRIAWDPSKPDGTMLKRMDTARIAAMGWAPRIPFEDGLAETYRWFLAQESVRA
jgi:GDP-L-fucose synthase